MDVEFDPTDEMDKYIKACCLHFKNNNYAIQINSEASFIKKHLLPFIDEMFLKSPDKNIICAMYALCLITISIWANYYSNRMDGAEQNGRMPDLKLGYKFKGKPHFAFFVEVKRPGQTSLYQDEGDFVKLLKVMKESINDQIDLGFEDPASLGLLVEDSLLSFDKMCTLKYSKIVNIGYKCILYIMKIHEEGVYIPVALKKFVLVEDSENVVNIPAIVESFFFVKIKLEKKLEYR